MAILTVGSATELIPFLPPLSTQILRNSLYCHIRNTLACRVSSSLSHQNAFILDLQVKSILTLNSDELLTSRDTAVAMFVYCVRRL